jgi:DNA-3-methyladenine glycosylase I
MKRCFGDGKDFYEKYHDQEWAVPVYDDTVLFEMLCLEGAQAGLSWETVLKRREGYKKLFKNFDPSLVSKMSDGELENILINKEVIRNRLKIFSVRKNALVFLSIQKEFGSFSNYIWAFVDNKPIKNNPKDFSSIPAKTEISDKISKDLKKRGMSFVGSTIIYAFM